MFVKEVVLEEKRKMEFQGLRLPFLKTTHVILGQRPRLLRRMFWSQSAEAVASKV